MHQSDISHVEVCRGMLLFDGLDTDKLNTPMQYYVKLCNLLSHFIPFFKI